MVKMRINMKRPSLQRFVVGIALVTAGIVVGAAVSTSNEVHGEVTAKPTRPAFKTGGQLALPVLHEMAATLHQIDARLARLEMVAQKLQTTNRLPETADN
jgi:hypothetical protein